MAIDMHGLSAPLPPEPWSTGHIHAEPHTDGKVLVVVRVDDQEAGIVLAHWQADGLIRQIEAAKRGLVENVITGDPNRKDA